MSSKQRRLEHDKTGRFGSSGLQGARACAEVGAAVKVLFWSCLEKVDFGTPGN